MAKTILLVIVLCLILGLVFWLITHLMFKVKREFDFDIDDEERRIREMKEMAEKLDRSLEDYENTVKGKNTNA